MICPYCKQEIPSKDFAVKTPGGNYFHMPCADRALDEWAKLKPELEIMDKRLDKVVDMVERLKGRVRA